ncbi:MAG: LamG-like jellyroll fold domain-containing protein [Bacteroidales bacterium]
MKKLLTTVTVLLCMTMAIYSQIKPAVSDQRHLWNFEDDTPMDQIGEAHGEPDAVATIHNGVLDLSDTTKNEGYLSLPADVINLKNYPAVSIEIWCLPYTSLNSPNPNMLWSFGQSGNVGMNYLFFTPGRWGTGVAARLSVGSDAPWANEDGLSFNANIGDSVWHHYVVTIDTNNIMKLYVDGSLLKYGDNAQPAIDTLDANHTLSKVSNESAFIGRSVYPDPTWKGLIELFAIWGTALTEENVLWLYQQGAKRSAIVNTIASTAQSHTYAIVVKNDRLYIPALSGRGPIQMNIYSVTGALVYRNLNFRNGDQVALKEGIYVAKIGYNNNLFTVKFIK